jgi:hypothetical protein
VNRYMDQPLYVQVLAWVAFALLALNAVLGWVFVARFSRVAWYATPEGRHLMKFTAALALTFTLSLLFAIVDPKILTRLLLTIGLFGWIAYELANRIRLQVNAKREVDRVDRETAHR